MTLVVTDEPPDRPEWVSETLRLVGESTDRARDRLLELVDRASEADLRRGTDDDWGLGQIAVHVLLVERGVANIVLHLAKTETPGPTGQPRPAASGVTREGIVRLAQKAADAMDDLPRAFPARPDMVMTAHHPFFGDLNAIAWLLTLPNHYHGHLSALERGTKSAL